MKTLYLLASLTMLCCELSAQQKACEWNYSSRKIGNDLYEVTLTASLQGGWHIYPQHPGESHFPTSVKFTPTIGIELKGSLKELGDLKSEWMEIFNAETKYYEKKLEFTQRLLVKTKNPLTVNGTIEFMICNKTQCLPPKITYFSIGIQ